MKIYIGGSGGLSTLPGELKSKLNEYMERGDELLVGDSCGTDLLMREYLREKEYRKVTVYASLATRRRENERLFFRRDPRLPFNADEGCMVWDGRGAGAFVNIMDMVYDGKPVTVFRTDPGETVPVGGMEDAKRLLPPEDPLHVGPGESLPPEMYKDVVDTCFPPGEMREYLLREKLSKYSVAGIVRGAPLSLEKKKNMLKALSVTDNILWDIYCYFRDEKTGAGLLSGFERLPGPLIYRRARKNSFSYHYMEFEDALEALRLKKGEIFYLREKWYDENIHDENDSGEAPFLSLNAALEALAFAIGDEEWEEDTCIWSALEKWTPEEDGSMANPYTYYLVRDEIVYFERNRYDESLRLWRCDYRGYVSSLNLDLPIPYSAGDIVTLDCLPFAPVKHVLLLEVNNGDCCGARMLYRRGDSGLWDSGALKHGHGWGLHTPMLSPLYRLSRFDGQLPVEEEPLAAVAEYMCGDAAKGGEIKEDFRESMSQITDEKLPEYIEGEKNERTFREK